MAQRSPRPAFKTSSPIFTNVIRPWFENWLPIFSARLLVTVGARVAAKLLWDEIQWGAGSLTLTLDRRAFFRWCGIDNRGLRNAIADLSRVNLVHVDVIDLFDDDDSVIEGRVIVLRSNEGGDDD